MVKTNTIYPLKGVVQHYDWGGKHFIPSILKQENPDEKPYAEYWLGAHDNAPSVIDGQEATALNDFISNQPEALGKHTLQHFSRLPYLLKILDVRNMLSIQVHPTREAAKIEFEAEEKKGIPRNSPTRNYRDDNHKPELMLALSDFYLLHGFRPKQEMVDILKGIPELNFLLDAFNDGNYRELYRVVMEMSQQEVNERLQPLVQRIIPSYRSGTLEKSTPDFWAARAALTYNQENHIDRGIFSVYLLNLVFIAKGNAIFQDAGIPHAYLEGQNIEIMANSDNVLRGGLTPKHVDVPELLKHVRFEATVPEIIEGIPSGNQHETVFKTPAKDFELSEIRLKKGEKFTSAIQSPDIFLVLTGEIEIQGEGGNFKRNGGESFFAAAGSELKIEAGSDAVIYHASVPYSHA